MKTKLALDNFGVQEMDEKEMQETNGGGIFAFLGALFVDAVVAAIVVLTAFEIYTFVRDVMIEGGTWNNNPFNPSDWAWDQSS